MSKGEKEEIIDLTEVVEEPSGSEKREYRERAAAAQDSSRGAERPFGEPWPSQTEVQSLLKEMEEIRAEVNKMGVQKEALQRKIEEWMAVEGSRVCERVAREMFPAIAAEVLRQEIEKLKAEAEEKA